LTCAAAATSLVLGQQLKLLAMSYKLKCTKGTLHELNQTVNQVRQTAVAHASRK